jgi:hypothetical protein
MSSRYSAEAPVTAAAGSHFQILIDSPKSAPIASFNVGEKACAGKLRIDPRDCNTSCRESSECHLSQLPLCPEQQARSQAML